MAKVDGFKKLHGFIMKEQHILSVSFLALKSFRCNIFILLEIFNFFQVSLMFYKYLDVIEKRAIAYNAQYIKPTWISYFSYHVSLSRYEHSVYYSSSSSPSS